jgi:pyruvate,water dikinase
MRGLGEIDLGRPRWREQPEQILDSLRSYLSIVDPAAAPDAVFARSERQAEAAATAIDARVRQSRGGRLKARVARFAIRRLRAFGGLRELPKFVVVQHMDVLRTVLLESGRALVEAGDLARADDLFYLRRDELRMYGAGEVRDWSKLIDQRRARGTHESRRRQIPRLLLSDGRAYYDSMGATPDIDGADQLSGSPVSPGVAEGIARVVLDPHSAGLQPGEILVCAGTDPAWTPLFFVSSALITEVGGMMTHGAVVAREYGIPAVVGVHDATRRIQTGQRLRVDGSSGVITVLDTPTPAN